MLFRNGADVANFGKGAQKSANTWYHLRYAACGARSLPAPNPAVGPPPGKRRPDAAAGFLLRRGRMAVHGGGEGRARKGIGARCAVGAEESCTAARRRHPVRRAPPSSAGGRQCAERGCRRCKKTPFRRPGFGAKALSLHVGRGERRGRSGVPQELRFSPHRSAKKPSAMKRVP